MIPKVKADLNSATTGWIYEWALKRYRKGDKMLSEVWLPMNIHKEITAELEAENAKLKVEKDNWQHSASVKELNEKLQYAKVARLKQELAEKDNELELWQKRWDFVFADNSHGIPKAKVLKEAWEKELADFKAKVQELKAWGKEQGK